MQRPCNELDADAVRRVLKEVFGFDAFRGKQQEAIHAALQGRDSFVLMPTGAGKSLCYTLPGVMLPGVTLVVSPLIALMQDQVASAQRKGIACDYLGSARTDAERRAILASLQEGAPLAGDGAQPPPAPRLKLVYVTPELLDTGSFARVLQQLHSRRQLSLFAIDEAHCLSSWGHDFRPAYRKLSKLRSSYPGVPLMALTATAAPKVRADILQTLRLSRDAAVLVTSFNRPNISYRVEYVDLLPEGQDEHSLLLRTLRSVAGDGVGSVGNAGMPTCIVYAHKRVTVGKLASFLSKKGVPCAAYHAGLHKDVRSSVLQRWASGEVPVVAATVAFGMGIDKSDVRLVVHFNLPKSVEGFYQESGRAGRDGLPSYSVLFYSLSDRSLFEFLAGKDDTRRGKKKRRRGGAGAAARGKQQVADSGGGGDGGDSELSALQVSQVVGYCCSIECRRALLLQHFGEELRAADCAGGCDVCRQPADVQRKVAQASLLWQQSQMRGGGRGARLQFNGIGGGGAGGGAVAPWGEEGSGGDEDDDSSQGGGSDVEEGTAEAAAAAKAARKRGSSGVAREQRVLDALMQAERLHEKRFGRGGGGPGGGGGSKGPSVYKLKRAASSGGGGAGFAAGGVGGVAAQQQQQPVQMSEAARSRAVQLLCAALRGNADLALDERRCEALAMAVEAACGRTSVASVYRSQVTNTTAAIKRATCIADVPLLRDAAAATAAAAAAAAGYGPAGAAAAGCSRAGAAAAGAAAEAAEAGASGSPGPSSQGGSVACAAGAAVRGGAGDAAEMPSGDPSAPGLNCSFHPHSSDDPAAASACVHRLWDEVQRCMAAAGGGGGQLTADEEAQALGLLAAMEVARVSAEVLACEALGKQVKRLGKRQGSGGGSEAVALAAQRVVEAWKRQLLAGT